MTIFGVNHCSHSRRESWFENRPWPIFYLVSSMFTFHRSHTPSIICWHFGVIDDSFNDFQILPWSFLPKDFAVMVSMMSSVSVLFSVTITYQFSLPLSFFPWTRYAYEKSAPVEGTERSRLPPYRAPNRKTIMERFLWRDTLGFSCKTMAMLQ